MNETTMKLANESMAAFYLDDEMLEDRELFVENLGILLSQTREGVEGCRLISRNGGLDESVIVTFKGGVQKRVNVSLDSYWAIIMDVCRYAR